MEKLTEKLLDLKLSIQECRFEGVNEAEVKYAKKKLKDFEDNLAKDVMNIAIAFAEQCEKGYNIPNPQLYKDFITNYYK